MTWQRPLFQTAIIIKDINSMHMAVFCGSSVPHNKEIVEAADNVAHT